MPLCVAAVHVRRFTPDYRAACLAWLKTSPFTSTAARPGPGYMPQYTTAAVLTLPRI
jgi:hypothetical protein